MEKRSKCRVTDVVRWRFDRRLALRASKRPRRPVAEWTFGRGLLGLRPLDHVRHLVEVMVGQRLFDCVVQRVARYVASLARPVLLSAIAVTAGASKVPGSPRLVDTLLT